MKMNELKSKFKIYFKFPQVWIFLVIIILMIIMFCLSCFISNKYWSSLCSNILTGLITGLVLCLLSGARRIYIARQKTTRKWLKGLQKSILEYRAIKDKFNRKKFVNLDEEQILLEMCASISGVNSYITQNFSQVVYFNPPQYCKRVLKYDVDECSKQCLNLKGYIDKHTNQTIDEKIIREMLEQIRLKLDSLNSYVYNEIQSITKMLSFNKKMWI